MFAPPVRLANRRRNQFWSIPNPSPHSVPVAYLMHAAAYQQTPSPLLSSPWTVQAPGPQCRAALLRCGSLLASRLNTNWYAVYVQTPRKEPTTIDAATQRQVADTLTLAKLLGS
jgi:hypothetical protein